MRCPAARLLRISRAAKHHSPSPATNQNTNGLAWGEAVGGVKAQRRGCAIRTLVGVWRSLSDRKRSLARKRSWLRSGTTARSKSAGSSYGSTCERTASAANRPGSDGSSKAGSNRSSGRGNRTTARHGSHKRAQHGSRRSARTWLRNRRSARKRSSLRGRNRSRSRRGPTDRPTGRPGRWKHWNTGR
jgi:hypothetical protein